ncbi:MAG: TetR/AcrR family transcriptional regulator [Bacteroidota bacterium]
MSKISRKEREKKRRREAILDAAESVVLRKGLEATRMDEIAERAELSKGTLYLYFHNKMELYLGLCERGSIQLNALLAKVLVSDKSGIQMIRDLGSSYIQFVQENPHYFDAFMYFEAYTDTKELANSEIGKRCDEYLNEAIGYITRALQVGMQDGTISDEFDPRKLAIQIWGATRGLIQMTHLESSGHYFSILKDLDMETEQMFREFMLLVLRGISTEKGKNDLGSFSVETSVG